VVGRIVLDGNTVHVSDVLADPEYTLLEWARQAGYTVGGRVAKACTYS
jgi:hypothetical protein